MRNSHPGRRSGRNNGQDPQRGQRDVHECLKELAVEGLGQETAQSQVLELFPGFHLAIEVIDHEPEQDQAQVPGDRGAGGGPHAQRFQAPQKGQPQREANREEELRHDRVSITTIRVVMLPYRPDRLEPADEVHQQHAGHRVAAELIKRDDAALHGLVRGAHSGHALANTMFCLQGPLHGPNFARDDDLTGPGRAWPAGSSGQRR